MLGYNSSQIGHNPTQMDSYNKKTQLGQGKLRCQFRYPHGQLVRITSPSISKRQWKNYHQDSFAKKTRIIAYFIKFGV
jgi:hypothetical protein